MRLKKYSWSLFVAVLLGCSAQPEPSSSSGDYQRVAGNDSIIVQCSADCAAAEADLVKLGATVNKRYANVAALSVTLPAGQLSTLSTLPSIKDVAKNRTVKLPTHKITEGRQTQLRLATLKDLQPLALKDQTLLDAIAKQPLDFGFDNALNKATVLHKAGSTGKGVVVALIDTGTANNADTVPALAGSVIGGELFVSNPTTPPQPAGAPASTIPFVEPSATSTKNDPHGTMTGTMIAGHAAFVMPNTEVLVQSLKVHAPNSVLPIDETKSAVPMIGTAPEASLYAFKVFDTQGNATDSDILDAMDRAITLKRNFDLGKSTKPIAGDGTEDHPFVYDALNIQVANMSLGGPSLFPGFEADDLLTLAMLKAGITLVVSAGNDGPVAMTNGSPASGLGALTVAAVDDAIHTRVAVDSDIEFGLGWGVKYRPTSHLQTSVFSSRGPTADGRIGIHLTANGVANFVQGSDGGIYLVDGTSFSSPMVAGAAALLRGAFPKATAAQVREALMKGANSKLLGDNSSALDQGNGYLDVVAARDLLQAGTLTGNIPELPILQGLTLVQDNIKKAGVAPVEFTNDVYTTDIKNLMPGQTAHFFVTNPQRGLLKVKISQVTRELPPEQQNQLPVKLPPNPLPTPTPMPTSTPTPVASEVRGDRLVLAITDAVTSLDSTPENYFVLKSDFEVIPELSNGVVRVAVRALSTNAGKISARLTLTRAGTYEALPIVATGSLEDAETDVYKLKIPESAEKVTFDLSWRTTWAYYPTHDIDLLLVNPKGKMLGFGATVSNPEHFSLVKSLMPGDWTVLVDGYMLHGFEDRYRLGIADQDGKALKVTPRKR